MKPPISTASSPRGNSFDGPKQVDCVVVNWNGGKLVQECIESIKAFGGPVEQIVVVDNGSTDGSTTELRQIDCITIVEAGRNLGFAKACNIGADIGSCEYILFLNPDARFIDFSLEQMVHFMDSEEGRNVGICGARLIDDRNVVQESCFNFTDFSTYLGHALGLDGRFPNVFTPTRPNVDYTRSQFVDQPIGAFFLVRRSLFDLLQGFDERFFVYFEEVDFTLRANKLGWRAYYFSETIAYHKGGGISQSVKPIRLFYTLRSRLIYAAKHFSKFGFISTCITTLLLEPFTRLIRASILLSWKEMGDTVLGYLMLYRALPRVIIQTQSTNIDKMREHIISGDPDN